MPGRVFSSLVGGRSPRSSASSVEFDHSTTTTTTNKMNTLKEFRRRSMDRPASISRRDSAGSKASRKISPRRQPAATLEMAIESPPLVLYGPPSSSSGALLSGQLQLRVDDAELQIHHFELVLNVSVTTNKPVTGHCPECTTQTTQLTKWDFLKDATTFKRGVHAVPFSYLLRGHLPASVQTPLGAIGYSFSAKAISARGDTITFHKSLNVRRAILPGAEKQSVRLFPPTNITANVSMNQVIHPIGDFTVYFRLAGMVQKRKSSQIRWRLRKAMWRIEEESQMISPACARHNHKLGGDGKGVRHESSRTIGFGEFKNGWKGNPAENDGEVEMEFQAGIKPGKDPVCDVQAASGVSVSHKLTLEMIVAEEWCPNSNTSSITPTGSARVLRMHFDLIVTERSGLGISWDEEQPPMYCDVPASPPTYTQIEDYSADQLERYDAIEGLDLN
ncbi:MAG: hypothetical protein M1837_003314 [Sclerophora amabilis]|nr:MAG: hypothetical protein M1837_003314 [Sclerophora amabilis]